jgi:DNA-directed RNA polymerase subunit L
MELKVVKAEDKKLLLELAGESLTITNLLREKLWEDKNVSEAAQIKEHPYLSEPKIWVVVKRGSPLRALDKATNRALDDLEKLKKEFKEKLK